MTDEALLQAVREASEAAVETKGYTAPQMTLGWLVLTDFIIELDRRGITLTFTKDGK